MQVPLHVFGMVAARVPRIFGQHEHDRARSSSGRRLDRCDRHCVGRALTSDRRVTVDEMSHEPANVWGLDGDPGRGWIEEPISSQGRIRNDEVELILLSARRHDVQSFP